MNGLGRDVHAKPKLKTLKALTLALAVAGIPAALAAGSLVSVTVQPKQTLWRLANDHGTTIESIEKLNGLPSEAIKAGQSLVIAHSSVTTGPAAPARPVSAAWGSGPPASPARAAPVLPGGAGLIWPLQGVITQGFIRGVHDGLDIGAPTGTPIVAVEAGTVSFAGWDRSGYGERVVVRGALGRSYSYAHASRLLVSSGQSVSRGQTIALVGSTGNSSGPHLDFRILAADGSSFNPLAFLPATRVQLAGYRPRR